MTLKKSRLFPGEAEIMCKYFSGLKYSRYGDFQSVRPVAIWDSAPGKYFTFTENGFVNILFEDSFLVEYICSFLRGISPEVNIPEPNQLGAKYRRYIFSIYINDIWHMKEAEFVNYEAPEKLHENHRRLVVMAIFLLELLKEKDPLNCESFLKLYDTFSNELYCVLSSGVITEASSILKMLAACAVNIPVYQEA